MHTIPPELARKALDAAPDAMILIDSSGVIRYANRHISSVFGYAHDEVVGRPVELLMPERFRTRYIDHLGEYKGNLRLRPMDAGLELYGRRKDGTEFPVEVSLSPIEHEERMLVAAAVRNVTERRRIEAELTRARERADTAREAADQSREDAIHSREVADGARELAIQARDEANRANQGKSRFLATASHDLRQPLQTLELLNGSLRRLPTSAAVTDAIAQQGEAIVSMSRLLNALLDIGKLESGTIKPDPTNFAVGEIFETLRHAFAATAASKGLEFQVSAGEEVAHSDPSLIEQILRNLISNAIKYTQRGLVSLLCVVSPEGNLHFEVRDTGIGIPATQIQYICDEFYQVVDPVNGIREGYGLGLSIVQRIVQLLRLTLEVRSEVGKGSVFSLAVPAGSAHVTHAPTGMRVTHADQQPVGVLRVLLVEDDRSVRDATRMLLAIEGYQVTGVATLVEALEHAAGDNGIDLLVTDYHLADGETGSAVISALRGLLGADLKAVLVTGDTSTAVKELPPDPLMRIASKPIQADELLTLMRALLAA